MSATELRAGARFGRRGGRFVGLLACSVLWATLFPSGTASADQAVVRPVRGVAPAVTVPTVLTFAAAGQTKQLWTVPDGVTAVQYDVYGADGVGPGGYAARVQGVLAVQPGQVLSIWVGLEGGAPTAPINGGPGGWGGRSGSRHGGVGGASGIYGSTHGGYGGGGATEIDLEDGTNASPVLVVAGGGGGVGYGSVSGCGSVGAGGCGAIPPSGIGGDGSTGNPGTVSGDVGVAEGGHGGTPAGGPGGAAPTGGPPVPGIEGDAGAAGGPAATGAGADGGAENFIGSNMDGGGGGGGGGGFGGGGGGAGGTLRFGSGGGGGGSGGSYPPAATFTNAAPTIGPGSVKLTYTTVVAPDGATRFVPLTPARLLDTRVPADITGGLPVAAGAGIDLQVSGRGGVPTTNVTAVVLNVTAAGSLGAGYITVWPSLQPKPVVSNLNVTAAGQNIANLATVKLGAGGMVSLFTQSGSHLVVDVAGYYEPVAFPTAAGRYTALAPFRLLDTRAANGVPGTLALAPDSSLDLVVAGRGGVPATGVSAVVLNVTAASATAPGFVTVWPTGVARPNASNINVTFAGEDIPNLVIVPVGAGGKVSLYTQSGTHLLADVAGWFTDSTQPFLNSGLFVSMAPTRVLDTRSAIGVAVAKPVAADHSIDLALAGNGGLPATGISAVVLNVTAAESLAPGFITAWPTGSPKPTASNLNVTGANQDIANLVSVAVGATGSVSLYTQPGGDLIADLAGYYIAPALS